MTMQSIIALLQDLVRTESFSGAEDKTATILVSFLKQNEIVAQRQHNNVWARNYFFDQSKPTVLLNSHHDTVKPNPGYSRNPFDAEICGNTLYGLGSNDAGASLVCLLSVFVHFYAVKDLPFNLIFAATAEEEISGRNGVEALLPLLGKIDCGIVGEPTQMQLAIAEKGLLVLNCTVTGKAGHAAREEGDNAIYKALAAVEWFRTFQFPKISTTLGPVKMSVTHIEAGKEHNVVPALCKFTVDVRSTDEYDNETLLRLIQQHVTCDIKPRSLRLNSSGISEQHPLVLAGKKVGRHCYGSPTLSDQALLPFPTIKIGPGDSARSHSADEFVLLSEISEAIRVYTDLLMALKF